MLRNSSLLFVATALAVGFSADAVSAQTFQACRVPSVGVIYMINVGDAPAACLDPSHVQFSWTEGGAPPDGSVTTAKLADDAVTNAKIANGTILPADLAAGIGVEFGSSFINVNPTTTSMTAASLTVSHPATGFIVAHGVGQIQCDTDTYATLGITNNTTGTDGWTYYPGRIGASMYTMVPKNEVIPVTGAGTATINFNIGLGADNCAYFRVINFDAIYVPVRY